MKKLKIKKTSSKKSGEAITGMDTALAIESIKDYAILMLDADGKILTWNKGAERIKGYKAPEIIGKSMSVFYTPEDRAKRHPEEMLKIAAKKGRQEDEGWRVRKNGSRFWADVVITALKDKKGKLRGFIKVTRDVTEIKNVQNQLREKTQAIDEIRDYAILMLDPVGKVLTWNAGAERIKGYKASEIIGKSMSVFYTPEDNAKRHPEKMLESTLKEGRWEDEGWRVRKDGSRFLADVVITALKDKKGKLIGFIKVTRDVTEIKKNQSDLQDKTKLLDSVLKNINDGVVAMDEKGQYFLFNPGAEKMLGKPSEDVRRGNIMKRFGIFRPDGITPFPESESVLGKAIQGEASHDVEMFVRNPGHPDGILLNVSGTPLLNEEGDNRGGVAVFRDVTGIKRTQKELQEKTELLNSVLKNINDGVVAADKKGQFIVFNPAAEKISGRSPDGARQGRWTEQFGIFLPDQVTAFPDNDNPLAKAIEGIETNNVEMFLRNPGHPDGILVAASGRPLLDEKGNNRGGVAIFRDVTEIEKAQRELQEKTEAVDEIKDYAILMLDPAGNVLTWNAGAERINGYNTFEIIGKPMSTFYTLEDNAKGHPRELLKIAEAEGRVEDEGWRVRKDGSQFMDNVVITALKDKKGKLRGFIKVTRDVTEIEKAQKDLEKKTELLNSVLKNIKDGVIAADEKGHFIVFNPAAVRMSGESTINIPPNELSKQYGLFYPDGETLFLEKDVPLNRAIRGEETNEVEMFLVNVNYPEGLSIVASGRPLLDEKGNSQGGLVILRDITEQRQQENVKIYTKALEVSNRNLQDFIFVASHDLQEPLRKIQSFGDFLREEAGPTLNPTALSHLSRIQGSAKRMSSLIEDLLQLTRVTTKAKPFEIVDLSEVIKEVCFDLETKLGETGGKIEAGELPKIEADPAQMRQLFQNLIANSLKYRQPNLAPFVKLKGEVDMKAGRCRVRIQDNGIGFEQKYADQIFNIFQRLHGRDEYEGTGIGLAICRKVVERHGGTITATSKPGEGALFEITLPLHQPK